MINCDCSIDVDECNLVDVTTVRKARKPHKCIECGEAIPVGQQYQEDTGIDAGHNPYRYRTCKPCAAIRDHYCSGGWYWGELAEQIRDCLGFDYRKLPEPWEAQEIDAEDAKRVAEERDGR